MDFLEEVSKETSHPFLFHQRARGSSLNTTNDCMHLSVDCAVAQECQGL